MSHILFFVANSAIFIGLYYIIKYIIRLIKCHLELDWISGPNFFHSTREYLGKDQVGYRKLFMKWQNTYGSYFKTWVGIYPVVVVADPALFQTLSNTGKNAGKSIEYKFFGTFCGLSLLTSDGDIWSRKRKMLGPSFHYEVLELFTDSMNIHALKCVNHLSKYVKAESFDFSRVGKLITLDILMDTIMGLNVNALENESNPYVIAAHSMKKVVMSRAVSPFIRNDIIYKFSEVKTLEIETVKILNNFVKQVIRKRKEDRTKQEVTDNAKDKESKKKAVLDILLDLIDSGVQIPDDEIESEVNTFIFAGHDTVSVALSYTLHLMGKYPDIQEKVYEEIIDKIPFLMQTKLTQADCSKLEYMDRCIKESLRMFPPVPLIGKTLNESLKTGKGNIPPNIDVVMNIYGLHNNEKFYPQPNIFNPDRFLQENVNKRQQFSYVPFGVGVRNCIGQRFAINELKILLAYIIKNYKIQSVQSTDDLKIGFDIALTPFNGVHIKLDSRL